MSMVIALTCFGFGRGNPEILLRQMASDTAGAGIVGVIAFGW